MPRLTHPAVLALATGACLAGAFTRHQPAAPAAPHDIVAAAFAASGPLSPGLAIEATWPVAPDEAFDILTSPDAWKDRFALDTNIDLAIGGRFELLFGAGATPPAPVGQQGSEGCQILAYVPGEVLAFSWNAPPSFAERAQHTWVVITLTPGDDANTTNLRLRHVGFGTGGRWAEVEAYFQNAWSRLLNAMGDDLRAG